MIDVEPAFLVPALIFDRFPLLHDRLHSLDEILAVVHRIFQIVDSILQSEQESFLHVVKHDQQFVSLGFLLNFSATSSTSRLLFGWY